MASFRDLARQRDTIQNQGRVFSALQTVSGVKFRRAEARVGRARPYADNMEEMMRDIARKTTSKSPLMVGRDETKSVLIATLSSDRGLCGGFNAQVLRTTAQLRGEKSEGGAELKQVASGRKAVSYFQFRRVQLTETFSGFSDAPEYGNAQEMGDYLTRTFQEEEADEVYLVYNRFQSALVQIPTVTRLLPVAPGGEEDEEQEGQSGAQSSQWSSDLPFEFVEDADKILARLIPQYVNTVIFQALLESAAGEHGARMTAMKNATDNANDLSERLTMQMNRARQAQITQEILEIASGAEALSTG